MKPIGILILAAALGACGGSDKPGPYMWGGAITIGAGAPAASCVGATIVTITYDPTGVSPPSATVPEGACVDFVNADSAAHWPESNPHPTHTQCPWLNMLASIPAWSGTGAKPHTTVGPAPATPTACGFHDHLNPPPIGGGGGGGY